MPHTFPVRTLVNTPSGPVTLTMERSRQPLPQGPDSQGPKLLYGPFFDALSRFLARDSWMPLRTALGKQQGDAPVPLEAIQRIELFSEKHGALYHVIRLRVLLSGRNAPPDVLNLAMNISVLPEQHAFLENEFHLLDELNKRFGSGYLPQTYLLGEGTYEDKEQNWDLRLFLAEWFEGFHEFHLTRPHGSEAQRIRVWYLDKGKDLLSPDQSLSLYREASVILTHFLDGKSFQQIYPWHHAAGDFILKPLPGRVELRMVTARDYRCLVSQESIHQEPWIAIIHFFTNLTFRMRLDRLEGTGELAWAGPECLPAVVEGFLHSWAEKRERNPLLPSSGEVLEVLRQFTLEEWTPLAELIVDDGLVEAAERSYLLSRLEEHVGVLFSCIHESQGLTR